MHDDENIHDNNNNNEINHNNNKNTDDNHNNNYNIDDDDVAAASDSLQVHKTCVESKCKPSDFAGECVCVHVCACGYVFERVCVPSPSTLQI